MTWASLWGLRAGLLLLFSDIALHLAATLPYLTGAASPTSLQIILENNNKLTDQRYVEKTFVDKKKSLFTACRRQISRSQEVITTCFNDCSAYAAMR